MSRTALFKISVATTIEAEDLVTVSLENIFGLPATVYTSERRRTSQVAVFCTKPADWTPARRRKLRQELNLIRKAGVPVGSGKITARLLPRENWAESWKRHFKPMQIGASLLVKPSWSSQVPRKGQKLIVLDPGLSFGTGQHPTTGFCLRQLARHRRTGHSQAFLDIGTGSGILAIAAAKLGYSPVEAFDFDPESVRVARENGRNNRVTDLWRLFQADLTRLPARPEKRFDFICANLISTLLLQEKKRIVACLKPGGVLVLAGILKTEFCSVQATYESLGLKFLGGRSEKEWRSGAFGKIV